MLAFKKLIARSAVSSTQQHLPAPLHFCDNLLYNRHSTVQVAKTQNTRIEVTNSRDCWTRLSQRDNLGLHDKQSGVFECTQGVSDNVFDSSRLARSSKNGMQGFAVRVDTPAGGTVIGARRAPKAHQQSALPYGTYDWQLPAQHRSFQ